MTWHRNVRADVVRRARPRWSQRPYLDEFGTAVVEPPLDWTLRRPYLDEFGTALVEMAESA
jgi:hypothetical protein